MRLPAQLLRRKADSHKGDFGHIFILAGSARYSGAAALCSAAAMRSGAGMVTVGIPQSLNTAFIRIKYPEVMTLPLPQTRQAALSLAAYKKARDLIADSDVVVIGPGLGKEKSTQALARRVICGVDRPIVIDADGLNAMAGHPDILGSCSRNPLAVKILTPHAGEMARLLACSVKYIEQRRREIACKFAVDHKVIVVLKGHNTIVADQRGNCYINKTGNAGMSTAGCGDVLSGMIAAFLGQGLEGFAAAKYAVYLHGLAGDIAVREKTEISLIATDIIGKIPQAIKQCS